MIRECLKLMKTWVLLIVIFSSYKDVGVNIYERANRVSPKRKVVVGPFVHAMPDAANRHPGPSFDSKAEMVRWFTHWLTENGQNSSMITEPDITLFIRSSLTTGTYQYESRWPIFRQQTRRMYMSKGQKLIEQTLSTSKEREINSDVDILEYRPWIGFEAGLWLGGLTEDQKPFDQFCLVYQSNPVEETIEIVGFVNVSLQAGLRIHTTSHSWSVESEFCICLGIG